MLTERAKVQEWAALMPGVGLERFGAPELHHGFYQSHVKTALIPAEKPNPNNEVQ